MCSLLLLLFARYEDCIAPCKIYELIYLGINFYDITCAVFDIRLVILDFQRLVIRVSCFVHFVEAPLTPLQNFTGTKRTKVVPLTHGLLGCFCIL